MEMADENWETHIQTTTYANSIRWICKCSQFVGLWFYESAVNSMLQKHYTSKLSWHSSFKKCRYRWAASNNTGEHEALVPEWQDQGDGCPVRQCELDVLPSLPQSDTHKTSQHTSCTLSSTAVNTARYISNQLTISPFKCQHSQETLFLEA